jgi:hypothetical protein
MAAVQYLYSSRYLISFRYEKSAGRRCFLLDKSCRKCIENVHDLFRGSTSRGKVTSWRLLVPPLAAPSIIKHESPQRWWHLWMCKYHHHTILYLYTYIYVFATTQIYCSNAYTVLFNVCLTKDLRKWRGLCEYGPWSRSNLDATGQCDLCRN